MWLLASEVIGFFSIIIQTLCQRNFVHEFQKIQVLVLWSTGTFCRVIVKLASSPGRLYNDDRWYVQRMCYIRISWLAMRGKIEVFTVKSRNVVWCVEVPLQLHVTLCVWEERTSTAPMFRAQLTTVIGVRGTVFYVAKELHIFLQSRTFFNTVLCYLNPFHTGLHISLTV